MLKHLIIGFIVIFQASIFGIGIGLISDVSSNTSTAFTTELSTTLTAINSASVEFIAEQEKSIRDQYLSHIKNPDVNVIIYLGTKNTKIILNQKPFKKPVFLPITSELNTLPPIKNGVTNLTNFSYLPPSIKIADAVNHVISIFGKGTHAIILSDEYADQINAISKKANAIAALSDSTMIVAKPTDLNQILIENTIQSTSFSNNIEPELLANALDELQQKQIGSALFLQLETDNLDVVSFLDSTHSVTSITRKTAFAIDHTLKNKNLSTLKITDTNHHNDYEIIINIKAAVNANITLDWNALFTATLINYDDLFSSISLPGYIEEAITRSFRLNQSLKNLDMATIDNKIAESYMKPSIQTNLYYETIDEDQANTTRYPQSKLVFNPQLKQMVYSSDIIGNVKASKALALAQQYDTDAVKADTELTAAKNYLTVEQQYHQLQLSKKTLMSSQKNYQSSLLKESLGSTNKTDVLRLHSQYLSDNASFSDAINAYRKSLLVFYNYIDQSITNLTRTEPINISPILESDHNKRLFKAINSPLLLPKLSLYIQQTAANQLPDVKQINALIQMQDDIIHYEKQKKYIPAVDITGNFNQWLDTQGAQADTLLNSMDDTMMSLRLNASYPLYDSNRQNLVIKKAKTMKDRLELEKRRLLNLLSLKLNKSLEDIRKNAMNYEFQQQLVSISEDNLQLVRQKYNLGRVPLLDLLDAQDLYRSSQTKLNVVSYKLLTALFEFERYSGMGPLFYIPGIYDKTAHSVEDILKSINEK